MLSLLLALLVPGASHAATITVNSTNDPVGFNTAITVGTLGATVTLRDAVNAANNTAGADTIVFDPSLNGATVGMRQGTLSVNSAMSISAPAGTPVLISRISGGRLFFIAGGASLEVTNLVFANSSDTLGGAIQNDGSLFLDLCLLTNNSAFSGGAILNNGTARMKRTMVRNCFAIGGGDSSGGGVNNSGTFSATESTFAYNTKVGFSFSRGGGAIMLMSGSVRLTNCTVAFNQSASFGGAIDTGSGDVGLVHCTIFGNTADRFSPGVLIRSAFFAQNTVSQDGAYGGPGNSAAVGLGTFGLNGGPTETFGLLPSSPIIGAGVFDANVPVDQRGVVRHDPPDSGAYEATPRDTLRVSTIVDEDNGATEPSLGTGTSLREALAYAASLGGTQTVSLVPSLTSGGPVTITLTNGPLVLPTSVNISGPGADLLTVSGNNAYRIFHVLPGANVTMTGLTLANGRVDNADPFVGSGGALKNEGTLAVTNCVFTNNRAGGASQGHGGAIFNLGHLQLVSSVLAGNRATNSGWGGAVHSHSGSVTILSTVFSNNIAGANGGAASSFGATMTITGSAFAGNRARDGGAVSHLSAAAFTMARSTVRDNVAEAGGYGGGVWLAQGSATFLQNTFHNNSSTGGNGGAIANMDSLVTATNCTFALNSSINGGAVIHYGNTLTLTHCTVMHNQAAYSGGGIERVGRVGNPFQLINTLVASNSAAFGADAYSYPDANNGVFTSLGNNLIANGDGALGFAHGVGGDLIGTPAAPIPTHTGELQNNGGPNWTISLLGSSPAVDGGIAISGLVTDQKDAARVQGFRPDIGAFEFTGAAPIFTGGDTELTWITSLPRSHAFSAQGLPVSTYSVSGSLPPGVTLSPSGLLSGTVPDGSGGDYTFSVVADNGYAPTASKTVHLHVIEQAELVRDPRFRANGLGWILNGFTDPFLVENYLVLTSLGAVDERNAAWFAFPLNITAFETSFDYYFGGSDEEQNAGAAFVIHNDARGTSALGGGGAGFGFSGISPSVAILINNFTNAAGGRGIDLGIHGSAASSAFHSVLPIDMDSGNSLTFKLTYYNGILQVRVIDDNDEPQYVTNLPINIPALVGGTTAWVGFTGGSETNGLSRQEISDFHFKALQPGTVAYEIIDWHYSPSDQQPPSAPLLAAGDTLFAAYPLFGQESFGSMVRFGVDDRQIRDVFKITNTIQGIHPAGAMALSGNFLFGATQTGGALDNGTIYRINASATNNETADYTVLHHFDYDVEGAGPLGGITLSDNTVYGALQAGGPFFNGGIYKMGIDGNGFTVLHSFPSVGDESPDGSVPVGPLALAGNTLYGATIRGGTNQEGTVFKIQTDGSGFTVLHRFEHVDGSGPSASPVVSGNVLFGTCYAGGMNEVGTIYRINTDGTGFTVLHHFSGQPTDGAFPESGLLLVGDELTGTTSRGGKHGYGTVFKMKTDGSGYTVLHEFNEFDGAYPNAVPITIRNRLYGTTRGVFNSSALYSLMIAETPSLIVTTTNDVVDAYDQLTSLREAVAYAATLPGPQTVTFSPALAGQTVLLNQPWDWNKVTSALSVSTALTIQGPTTAPGVTLAVAPGVHVRHFLLESSGHLTLSHLTLTGGNVPDFGGSIWSFGSLTVRSCTFTGNSAVEGAAIQSWDAAPLLHIENSTFTGNTAAGLASAISAGAVQTTLRHLTVTGNNGPQGVLWLYNAVATMQNTILAGNNGDGVLTFGTGAFSVQSVNNILGAGGSAGLVNGVNGNLVGFSGSSLQLAPLAFNGGPTPTIALLPGSPAIEAGLLIPGLSTDQRGANRLAGLAPDIGAYEDPTGAGNPTFAAWRAMHGLAPNGSQDSENPAGDGVANLFKYAFNLAPTPGTLTIPNRAVLPTNGAAGLPSITPNTQNQLVIRFVRRKASTNPGIGYSVLTSSDLATWSALDMNTATVESIDATWERVTIIDPNAGPKRFGRVGINYFEAYRNDFNAGLGFASVRGSAVWTNQSVMLTDTIGGQLGAVIFDGLTTSPAVNGFTARFNTAIGPTTTGIPADGINFAVGAIGAGVWSETGPGLLNTLSVGFDTYNNGGVGDIGIHVWLNGVHIAGSAVNPYTDGATVPVEISFDTATGVTVRYNGATIFNQVPTPGFVLPAGGQFGISARTGGANERAVVDDVEIRLR